MNPVQKFSPGPTTLALVGNVFVHPTPLLAVDNAAAMHLYDLLVREAQALASLSSEIAAVGSSPSKFNDVSDFAWRFARVDGAVFDGDTYAPDVDPRKANPGKVTPLTEALDVLDRLERASWRQWWTRAFGEWFYDNFIVLMVQDGAPWLLYATSNAGDHNSAYSLWQEDRLVYFGETYTRMDERLNGAARPLQFVPPDALDRWYYE